MPDPEYPLTPFEYDKGCTMQEVSPKEYILRVPYGTQTERAYKVLSQEGGSVTVEYYTPALPNQ